MISIKIIDANNEILEITDFIFFGFVRFLNNASFILPQRAAEKKQRTAELAFSIF